MENNKENAYKLALEQMRREVEWTGKWSDKLNMIKQSYFYRGSSEWSVGIKSGNSNLLEVRIGSDYDKVYDFDIKKVFDTVMAEVNGQASLF